MLLDRLAKYAQENADTSRPYHSPTEFHWQLDIYTQTDEITEARLTPLADETDSKRGISHEVPAIVRSSGIEPFLAADDVQYVLGWADKDAKSKRVHDCHAEFITTVERWAASPEGLQDHIAQTIAQFYRSGLVNKLDKPEKINSKQRVLIAVNDQPAYEAPSVVPFWTAEIVRRKGTGKDGTCLVCGTTGPLLKIIPTMVPSKLIPGADSSGAALVTINNPVFGYDLSEQLAHVPICIYCGNDVPTGLIKILSSGNILKYAGQDGRTGWWLVNPALETTVHDLDDPDIDVLTDRLESIWKAEDSDLEDHLNDEELGLYCSVTVGGHRSRIMVLDWIEMPLARLELNVRDWFRDHQIRPQWPDGDRIFGLHSFADAFGRWESKPGRYARRDARNADRPRHILRTLHHVAVRNTPLPPALRAHLVRRICRDGHVDDCRAALIRLALNRHAYRKETRFVSPGLDPTHDDPAYLAGRIFAVLTRLQIAAHSKTPNKKKPDSDGSDTRDDLNTTYSDRFFAGAARNPRAALTSGRLDAKAWLSKIRRGGAPGLAIYYENQLTAIYAKLSAAGGLPTTSNLRQQEQFILGYHHQRAERSNNDSPDDSAEEPTP